MKLFVVLATTVSIAFSTFTSTPAFAANGKLLLATPTTTLSKNAEFNVTLRVDPGTPILGVLADVTYDANKLSYVSSTPYGTSFPNLWSQTPETGKISTMRETAGGAASGSKVVVTYRFKAIASSGQTVVRASGVANANNSELKLSDASLTLNIASASTAVAAAQTTPTSGGGSSSTASSTGTSGTSGGNSPTAKPDSVDVEATSETSEESSFEVGGLSLPGTTSNIITDSKLPLLLGLLMIPAVVGGAWFGIRKHRLAMSANNYAEGLANTNYADTPVLSQPTLEVPIPTQPTPPIQPGQPGAVYTPQPKPPEPQTLTNPDIPDETTRQG